MSNNISLTASMRSNLLSLQNIAAQVDLTQNRLSTGLKVNSAIDNPSSYYTAVSLNNRASDLSALLDSMAQGIQTIKAATEGLEAGAKLLEQAAATATQALETVNIPSKSWFEAQEGVAAVVSTKEEFLAAIDSGKKGDIVIYGQIDMGNTAITLQAGQNLTGIGAYGVADNERGKFSALSFEVTGTPTKMISTSGNISDLSISAVGDAETKGFSVISINNKKNSLILKNLDFYADVANLGWASSLFHGGSQNNDGEIIVQGINNFYSKKNNMAAFWQTNLTIDPGTVLNANISKGTTFAYSNVEINSAYINSSQSNSYDFLGANVICNGNTYINGGRFADGSLTLNDQSRLDNAGTISTSRLIVNSMKATINIKDAYLLSDWTSSSNASVKAVAGSKISLAGQVYQLSEDIDYTLSADTRNETPPEYQKVEGETFVQPDLSFLDALSIQQTYQKKTDGKQYAEIIKQYDSLIKDSSYKGINLLREQDLTVTFNENRSAQLSVQGKDASVQALGLVTTDWQNQGDVVKSIQELTEALNQIRQMSSEFGNYYSIVTTRENFTQNLINVLTEGADKLTLADMNEESANMLALQTRQQLAINSLSLASQASQSILKLF